MPECVQIWLYGMSRSERGQKIEFNLNIPGKIIFTNPTDKCPEKQQWNVRHVYPYLNMNFLLTEKNWTSRGFHLCHMSNFIS